MPREASAPSDFRKSVKSGIGHSFSHFRPGGRWDKKSSMPTTGKHIGQKKQNEWQDEINVRSKIILSGTFHNNIPDYLPGLSSSNRQTLDKIRSHL